jgi:hypothetical protein
VVGAEVAAIASLLSLSSAQSSTEASIVGGKSGWSLTRTEAGRNSLGRRLTNWMVVLLFVKANQYLLSAGQSNAGGIKGA